MHLKTALKQFGLTDKQAKAYLATLELGSAPVSQISQKAKIPRPTCYDVLESLREQGIASTFIKNKTRWFTVEDPRKMVSLARQKVETLNQAMPELEALWGDAQERPQVRFYQGKDGIKQIFEEILQDGQEIIAFNSVDDLFKTMGKYQLEFVKRRVEAKIPGRLILRDTPKGRERQKLGPKELRLVKFIPDKYNFHGGMAVFGNKIAYFSFIKDYVAVIIESQELAQVQSAALQYIWEKAES
ncbi:MAG: helix-turn-helix domain-containing protein [Candidatus Jacksonbacteria bacterium]